MREQITIGTIQLRDVTIVQRRGVWHLVLSGRAFKRKGTPRRGLGQGWKTLSETEHQTLDEALGKLAEFRKQLYGRE